MTDKLLQHQREGIEFLRREPRAALFDEPGLGKSAQALLAAEEPVLVVAPAMIIQGGVWDDEVARWAPGADVTQVPYSRLMVREGRAVTDKLVPELDRWEAREGRRVAYRHKRTWGTVIADEAHYLKGRKTHWTAAFKQIRANRTTLLTGTPIPNWAHEAFVPLQLLFPEEAQPGLRLGSYWRWVEDWFELGKAYGKGGKVVSDHVIGDLRADRSWDGFQEQNWRDRAIRRLRVDCLDLPPLTEQWLTVDMGREQARVYRALEKDFVAWLDSGAEVTAWSKAGQLVKLAQVATGLGVVAETQGGKAGDGKLDALEGLLADRALPTLVVAHFRASVRACAARAHQAGRSVAVITGDTSAADRGARVRAFQQGKLDVLCASIDTISEGLTLTAADQVIFVERSWRPSRNEQAQRRVHRMGQTRPVTAVHLVARDTVDERVLGVLKAKTDQQMRALSRVELRGLAR